MAHFARINEQNIVEQVIVAEQEFIDSGAVGNPDEWLQTSYNTQGGIHTQGGTPFRKNFASIGYFYDRERDAFIPPQPYSSWALDEESCLWKPPTPKPELKDNEVSNWNEEKLSWEIKILE